MKGKSKYRWFRIFVCSLLAVHFAMSEANDTTILSQQEGPVTYTWTPWGSWSPCSRTCGGGVSVQERHCVPRTRNLMDLNNTLPVPMVTVRVTRQIHDCIGVDKRYHECNTKPCPGGLRDKRVEQCASFDRRPFRGRFYTWVPYIDGNSPCTLNCRPLGQQFYASLSLVADGTPCTRPGSRAICVQGECKVVGRESVLALASNREVRCGRRLVSGLFSRPRLPLGYSYVATVPRGACRLNVSELMPTDNYIALKISDGSYIMNGEFAVSAPGTYDAAGARFIYTRTGGLDSVIALGPTLYPIDIMILYTKPSPNIKYQYFIDEDIDIESITNSNLPELPPVPPTKHTRRHYGFDYPRIGVGSHKFPDLTSMSKELSAEDELEENIVGGRKFMWKITSWTHCSRSCGGGFQVGKYRCVETSSNSNREVSPVHCSGSSPSNRRRRCGNIPCAPRWRSAAWSACPKCGPATKTRIVGCVQDHSRGIIKVNDQKCSAPKPDTEELCDIPSCNEAPIERRGRPNTETFRDSPVYTISVNTSGSAREFGPEYSYSTIVGWLTTEWSECVGWCTGGGVQSRGVRCTDPSGCSPREPPVSSRACEPQRVCSPHEGQWFVGEWSPCTSECGKQVRGVLCVGGTGRHLRDSACKSPRPEHERDCEGQCTPQWYLGDWGQCIGNCSVGIGMQRRSVICANGEESAKESDCEVPKPTSHKVCEIKCDNAIVPNNISPNLEESQKDDGLEPEIITTSSTTTSTASTSTTASTTTTIDDSIEENEIEDCEDKLRNCALAVQARLCHYNYYTKNCCDSCKGR